MSYPTLLITVGVSAPPEPVAMYMADGSFVFTYCISFLSVFGPTTTPSLGDLSFTQLGVIITLSPFLIILSIGSKSKAFSNDFPSVNALVMATIGSFTLRFSLILSPLYIECLHL